MRKFRLTTTELWRAGLFFLIVALCPGEAEAAACSVAWAAGKPVRPPMADAAETSFRIFWHVATQIEGMADAGAKPALAGEIKSLQRHVDGYYFNLLPGGPLAYWPERPAACATNFLYLQHTNEKVEIGSGSEPSGRDPARIEEQCNARMAKTGRPADTAERHRMALRRVLLNLGVAEEQARGKAVVGEMLVINSDFALNSGKTALELRRLPKTYCFLNDNGITPDSMLIYQEPKVQMRQGSFLQLPVAGPPAVLAANPRRGALPGNTVGFEFVAGAFLAADVPLRHFAPNIRHWNPGAVDRVYARLAASRHLSGFFFEGGPQVLAGGAGTLRNFAEGAAWILQYTDDDVTFLVPAYWPTGQLAEEAAIDSLIPRLEAGVRALNRDIGKAMGLLRGRNALCTGRVVFIPASYGGPIHPRTFPARRSNGGLAGTVAGQIEALASLRRELCGG